MIPEEHKNGRENTRKFFIAGAMLLFAVLIFSHDANALALADNIGGYFNNYASNDAPQFLDVMLFSIIFFAVCYIGFNTAFKDAKNANIVLALAVGLTLSIALVYGGNFTVKKALPFATVLLFIVLMLLMYSLLRKFMFTKDTVGSKILTFLFALLITLAIATMALDMLCSGNKCENNAFTRKLFGSESIFGKGFGSIDSVLGTTGSIPPTAEDKKRIKFCGNGILETEAGEVCDNSAEPYGCEAGWFKLDQLCDNCQRCADQTWGGAAIDNWPLMFLGIPALIAICAMLIKKRKTIKESTKNLLTRKIFKKKALKSLAELLSSAKQEETSILHNFRILHQNIESEKGTFDEFRRSIDAITKEVKETIGAEIDFVSTTANKDEIKGHVTNLIHMNHLEKALVVENILPHIISQLEKMKAVPEELRKEIDELENVHEHFQEHKDILDTFKQHNFSERNVIANIIIRIEDNKSKFNQMGACCSSMISMLDTMNKEILAITGREVTDYDALLRYIKEIKDGALKLSSVFLKKVNLLHYLVNRLKEVKDFVTQLHEKERAHTLDLLNQAETMLNQRRPESAIYFAAHVVANADALENKELAPDQMNALNDMSNKAKAIINKTLPNLFKSLLPKIQSALDKKEIDQVIRFTENAERLKFIKEKLDSESKAAADRYIGLMERLRTICERLNKDEVVEEIYYHEIGLEIPSFRKDEELVDVDDMIEQAEELDRKGNRKGALSILGKARSYAAKHDAQDVKERIDSIIREMRKNESEEENDETETVSKSAVPVLKSKIDVPWLLQEGKMKDIIMLIPIKDDESKEAKRNKERLDELSNNTIEIIKNAIEYQRKNGLPIEGTKQKFIELIENREEELQGIRDSIKDYRQIMIKIINEKMTPSTDNDKLVFRVMLMQDLLLKLKNLIENVK